MSHDNTRRSGAVPFSAPESIPAAPPLPAPRPLQRAREAATRFFGYSSRSTSPQRNPEDERTARGGRGRYASLSVKQNATTSHRTGLEINTLSINEKGTHALIGGKEIFKTVRVEDGSCAEDLNLRSAIRSTPTQASGQTRQIYSIDIADVAWAKGDCGNYVAAATSSGKIILYDLGHAGLPAAQLHEHFRQVHRVTFNPHRGCLLLSGSQDGTVRLWDVRDVKHAGTLQSKRKYSGQSDGVRDVKWSPTDGVDFAFGTDSGWIQRWDMRNLKTPKVRIAAHSETCNSIDWHPDGKHMASASSDKTVRVWDFSSAQRQQKASFQLTTPYRVVNARWRPPCESSNVADSTARLCTQLVTAYDNPVLHLWDFRRPSMPFREIYPYSTAPTDLLWHSQDLLWTVGKEGVFLQTDIQHAPKVINKRNLQAFALSPQNEITFVTQKRRQLTSLQSTRGAYTLPSITSSRSDSPELGSLSRSLTDDGLDHSFLSRPPTTRGGRATASSIRQTSVAAVSVLNEVTFTTTLKLDDALQGRESLRPQQVMWTGPMPTAPDPKIFVFLAQNYSIDLNSVPVDEDFLESYEKLLDHNSRCAHAVGLYRTAQTWRIVSFMMTNYLRKRAVSKSKRRDGQQPNNQAINERTKLTGVARTLMNEQSKSPTPTPASLKPVSAITQQLALSDIASDQYTPLVNPAANTTADKHKAGELPDLDKEEGLTLPPSLSPALAQNQPQQNRKLTSRNLDGLEKLQQSESSADKANMVRRWSAQNEPLNSEAADARGIIIQASKLEKRASTESFTFLQEGSADSREPSFPSSFASSTPLDMVAERPSRHVRKDKDDESKGVEVQDFDKRPATSMAPPSEKKPTVAAQPRVPTIEEAAETINWIKQQDNKSEEATERQEELTSPFLPADGDEDIEEGAVCTMVDMLRELVNYYTGKGDSQTAAHLLLLLAPLLPRTHPLSDAELGQTIPSYVESFTSAGCTNEETESIIEKHLIPLINAGLQPIQVENVLATYHDQLMRRRLHNEAAFLRRLSFPAFPSVYEQALKDNSIHLRCGECGKPVGTTGTNILACENCRSKHPDCPICWLKESPYEDQGKKSTLMTACLRCGHMGHSACLEMWWEEGDGGCPTMGCLCDCVPGTWRVEKTREEEQRKQAAKGHVRVKSDDLPAKESKAVEHTRDMLRNEDGNERGLGLST